MAKKQPSRGILKRRCSENMQQIYRRTPMSKCYFNKVAKQLYWNRTLAWVFFRKFAARAPFLMNTSGRLLPMLSEVNFFRFTVTVCYQNTESFKNVSFVAPLSKYFIKIWFSQKQKNPHFKNYGFTSLVILQV